MKKSIISHLKSNFTTFSNADQRVASVVLDNPEKIMSMSIGKFASLAQVSEPTIVRFCRTLEFEGFKEFKMKLTQELATPNLFVHKDVQLGDDVDTYVKRVGQFTMNSISLAIESLDTEIIQKAVLKLSNASKIEFWGFGASAVVAKDAFHKFFRLGIPCITLEDTHMQAMSAAVSGKGTVIFAVSHTGRSKELLENVDIALKSGAVIVALTKADSPLAKLATISIETDTHEDTSIYTPMASRIIHLMIIDMLVIGVTLQAGEERSKHLKDVKQALLDKKMK